MLLPDLIVRSRQVVTPAGTRAAAIHIRGGRVIGVLDFDNVTAGCALDDVEGVVLPGLVDTRVHVQAHATAGGDAFERATRAAAAGGITTIVDAPVGGSGPTTDVPALEAKRQQARGRCWVDVGFWAGAVPGNTGDLRPLFEAGVFGFACTLSPHGDFTALSEADLRRVMPGLRNIGATLLVHAELEAPIDEVRSARSARQGWFNALLTSGRAAPYRSYLDGRPKSAEDEGIVRVVGLCREYQTNTHIVHLSSSGALTPLYHARAARLPISVETCPHYLNLVAEELAGDSAELLANAPPIRERENREFLWAALTHGLIQMSVADRFTPLQLSLPSMWTGMLGRGNSLDRAAEWMSAAPARLAGLTRKGRIDVGYDADLVVFRPDVEYAVESVPIRQRHAYRGRLRGVIERTYLRGARIYSRVDGWAALPSGSLMARAAS